MYPRHGNVLQGAVMKQPTVQDETARLLAQLAQQDPKRLGLLAQVLCDPRRAIESLDLLIRSPGLSEESRERYRGLRNSLEDFAVKERANGKEG